MWWSKGTNKDSEIKWPVTYWSPYAGWTGRKEAQQSTWRTRLRSVSSVHRCWETLLEKEGRLLPDFMCEWNGAPSWNPPQCQWTSVFPTKQWVCWGQGLSVISVLCGPIRILAENWRRHPFSSPPVLPISSSCHAILWPFFWTLFQEAPFFFFFKKFFIFNWRIIAL